MNKVKYYIMKKNNINIEKDNIIKEKKNINKKPNNNMNKPSIINIMKNNFSKRQATAIPKGREAISTISARIPISGGGGIIYPWPKTEK